MWRRENLARADELSGTAHRVLRWWRPYAHSPCRLGSSYNACQCALPFMESCLPDVQIRVVTPHRFVHYEPAVAAGELVAVVTQSGLSTTRWRHSTPFAHRTAVRSA